MSGFEPIEILYDCPEFTVCVKPCGVNSQECSGGVPELLSVATGWQGGFFTVHRLDREVGGVMVYAKSRASAAALTRQMGDGGFDKRYLAVLCLTGQWRPGDSGELRDLLYHDHVRNKTYVVDRKRAGVREAVLEYRRIALADVDAGSSAGLCLVDVHLITGRTHQIRVQFASRKASLLGDAKYGGQRNAGFGLWSYQLSFYDPQNGEHRIFRRMPPEGHSAYARFGDEILKIRKIDIYEKQKREAP